MYNICFLYRARVEVEVTHPCGILSAHLLSKYRDRIFREQSCNCPSLKLCTHTATVWAESHCSAEIPGITNWMGMCMTGILNIFLLSFYDRKAAKAGRRIYRNFCFLAFILLSFFPTVLSSLFLQHPLGAWCLIGPDRPSWHQLRTPAILGGQSPSTTLGRVWEQVNTANKKDFRLVHHFDPLHKGWKQNKTWSYKENFAAVHPLLRNVLSCSSCHEVRS